MLDRGWLPGPSAGASSGFRGDAVVGKGKISEEFNLTPVEVFEANVEQVLQLSSLDRRVLDQAIESIERRDQRLRNARIDNPHMLAGSTLQNLRNIREHDSLRPGFKALVNQSVVLLVSHFASGVSSLFRAAVAAAIETGTNEKLSKLQIKLTVSDLARPDVTIPDRVAEGCGASFQDTGSIARVFSDLFDHAIDRDKITNNVTAGLELRHVLVHNGGKVDRKCHKKIGLARPRELKPDVALDEVVEFETEEVVFLAEQMVAYQNRLGTGLKIIPS